VVAGGSPEIGGNVISGNATDGVLIEGGGADLYSNNDIGTNAAGNAAIANADAGIKQMAGSSDITQSVISGNGTDGINIVGGTSTIDNCEIGSDASGTINLGNGENGIRVTPGDPVLTGSTLVGPGSNVPAGQTYDGGPAVDIGSQSSGATAPNPSANVIAFNGHDGVLLGKTATAVIRGNSIFSNANLGIDYTGGTPSAAVIPTIESVSTSSSGTTITFYVPHSISNGNAVDFFVSPAGSIGEGQTYLGSMTVQTTAAVEPFIVIGGGSGSENVFTFATTTALTSGEVLTATNTRLVQAVANGTSYPFTTSPFSSAYSIA